MADYDLKPKSSLDGGYSSDKIPTLPSNSNIRRIQRGKAQQPVVKAKPIVSGKVSVHKKNLVERLDIPGILEDALKDKIIPGLMDIAFDSIVNVASSAIYGDDRMARGASARRRPNMGGNGYVSYRSYYDKERDYEDRARYARSSNAYDPDDIVFATREDAQNIFYALGDIIDNYGQASVADLYDLAGLTAPSSLNRYGWTDISNSKTRMVRDGYVLIMPKEIVLD